MVNLPDNCLVPNKNKPTRPSDRGIKDLAPHFYSLSHEVSRAYVYLPPLTFKR